MAKPKTTGIKFRDKHLTKQDHGGSADINGIAQQYLAGSLPYPDNVDPQFADLTQIDVARARDIVALCKSQIDVLPSDVRDFFNHQPEALLNFLAENQAEIEEHGLAQCLHDTIYPPPAPAPQEPIAEESAQIAGETGENADPVGDGTHS